MGHIFISSLTRSILKDMVGEKEKCAGVSLLSATVFLICISADRIGTRGTIKPFAYSPFNLDGLGGGDFVFAPPVQNLRTEIKWLQCTYKGV